MAARLPKPQLRNLFADYVKKRMAAIVGVSFLGTIPVYYYGVRQIKNKHLDYFSKTDPYELEAKLIKDGAFTIVTPDGTVTWSDE